METKPKTDIVVNLIGQDGNAFSVLGLVRRALIDGGRKDLVAEYMEKAVEGDYNHLLQVTMEYVEVE